MSIIDLIVKHLNEKGMNSCTFKQPDESYSKIINETLPANASAGDYIKDFEQSDNSRFKGDSKAKRKSRALAAFYGKHRSVKEENIKEQGALGAIEPLIGEDGKKKKKKMEDGGRSQTGSIPNRFQNIGRDTAQNI